MSQESSDLCNNPFVALFGSIGQVELYKTSVERATNALTSSHAVGTETSPAVDTKSIAAVNSIIEDVFLITINKETKHRINCVFLEDLHTSLDCQDWLDLQCLDQAVFERVMMADCHEHLVNDAGITDAAAESHPIRYLCDCYVRLKTALRTDKSDRWQEVYSQCQYVIALNSRLCFQQPDLFAASEAPSVVFLDLMTRSSHTGSDLDMVVEYFELVATEIASNKDDGSVLEAFRPALNHISDQLSGITLTHSQLLTFADLVVFFTRNVALAEAIVEYIKPRDMKQGKEYGNSLLGRLLSVSCLAPLDGSTAEFFDRPTRLSQPEVDTTESMIYQLLGELQDRIYRFIYSLLKIGGNIRDAMLDWLGGCLHANAGRAKMWSHQMLPQMFNAVYSSDAFFINLAVVMLRLCGPVILPRSDHVLRIQPTYCLATVGDRDKARACKVHMIELKDTCMVPTSADESPAALEPSYSFTTECFFMTHHTLSLGFRVLHERLVQLNRDLHRIQELYRDVTQQGAADAEPARRLKDDMERIMTVYLSLKAALSQPALLDSCFTFYTATATFLVKLVVNDDDDADTAAVAMATSVPSVLQYIPELLTENVQDFMLFLRHFKDQMFEHRGSDDLGHLLTFILVFMGSPQYMRNPHLRAGMAEALETLLPPRSNPTQPTMSLLSTHFQREHLFETHSMVDRLSASLVSVFVSIEMTGQGVQFEQKFKYRQPMYVALEYIWRIDSHRSALKSLASYAEQHIGDTEAPLFLRFINLLVNDAIFLLDEALSYMMQIREKQEQRESGEWQNLPANQRAEAENGYRHTCMLARFHNIMGNETIHTLEMMTTEITTIFTNSVMVDRIAAMLNYFLLHLTGPKNKNLKVKNYEEFEFRPRELVANICRIYIHLGEDDNFCRAVSRDGRSYSRSLFDQAELVLCKIHESADTISSFRELGLKIWAMGCEQQAEEEALANVPEDFLDPIMGELMRDPVVLPSSGQIVDRATIARHILSDQFDPFNRQPLTMDMIQPATELKQQIDAWLADNRKSQR